MLCASAKGGQHWQDQSEDATQSATPEHAELTQAQGLQQKTGGHGAHLLDPQRTASEKLEPIIRMPV